VPLEVAAGGAAEARRRRNLTTTPVSPNALSSDSSLDLLSIAKVGALIEACRETRKPSPETHKHARSSGAPLAGRRDG
jgi:hypothetical protein